MGLITVKEPCGVNSTHCLSIFFLVFAFIIGAILFYGIIADAVSYAYLGSYNGCYKYNGCNMTEYSSFTGQNASLYAGQNIYDGCCIDKKLQGFNSSIGSCVDTNSQCAAEVTYDYRETCFCCLEERGDVWAGVSDCTQIKGKLKNFIVSTFTFNLLAFVFLIMSCCGYCIVCATADSNNMQEGQANHAYPIAVANLAQPFGYGHSTGQQYANAPIAMAAAAPMATAAPMAPAAPMVVAMAQPRG